VVSIDRPCLSTQSPIIFRYTLKVVSSEKVGRSGIASTIDTLYEGVMMGVLLSFDKAAILYRGFNSAPS
jgi:hypothetical protein